MKTAKKGLSVEVISGILITIEAPREQKEELDKKVEEIREELRNYPSEIVPIDKTYEKVMIMVNVFDHYYRRQFLKWLEENFFEL